MNNVKSFLSGWTNRSSMLAAVRVNGLDTTWGKNDLKSIAAARKDGIAVDAIVVPKVCSMAQVCEIDEVLRSGGDASSPLWCMIETPAGVHQSYDIASHARVQSLLFGSNDLSKELRAKPLADRAPLLYSMSRVLLAARAHGKGAADGVYNAFRDLEGFRAQCEEGRQLGFDGKTLIHPGQVGPCNEAFSPTAAELEGAREVVKRWREAGGATAGGGGVVSVDGQMIEGMHAAEAQELLDMFDGKYR